MGSRWLLLCAASQLVGPPVGAALGASSVGAQHMPRTTRARQVAAADRLSVVVVASTGARVAVCVVSQSPAHGVAMGHTRPRSLPQKRYHLADRRVGLLHLLLQQEEDSHVLEAPAIPQMAFPKESVIHIDIYIVQSM